jgi:hypothetical protein
VWGWSVGGGVVPDPVEGRTHLQVRPPLRPTSSEALSEVVVKGLNEGAGC